MSKVKSPRDKKQLSLSRDRRNVYGECPTSSRRNIRRGKQRGHMDLRRKTSQVLTSLKGSVESIDADETESLAKAKMIEAQRAAFKKLPDAPLGYVIKRKAKWRAKGRSGNRPTPNA